MVNCKKIKLNNGVEIPQFGLGVFRSQAGEETANAVQAALEAGYRHIDTAMAYRNESDVAEGFKASGLKREEVFITSKLSTRNIGEGKYREGIESSLQALDTDYIDLYLIHWPQTGYVQAWEEMIKAHGEGKLRAIGVSNFQYRHLEALEKAGLLTPAVNQIELHPVFQQPELKKYCEERGIYIEAWSPLGGQDSLLIDHPAIVAIAQKYQKTGAQVILRWHIQYGTIVIPKSVKQHRIVENADIFDFELDDSDMAAIKALDTGKRLHGDPDRYE